MKKQNGNNKKIRRTEHNFKYLPNHNINKLFMNIINFYLNRSLIAKPLKISK